MQMISVNISNYTFIFSSKFIQIKYEYLRFLNYDYKQIYFYCIINLEMCIHKQKQANFNIVNFQMPHTTGEI